MTEVRLERAGELEPIKYWYGRDLLWYTAPTTEGEEAAVYKQSKPILMTLTPGEARMAKSLQKLGNDAAIQLTASRSPRIAVRGLVLAVNGIVHRTAFAGDQVQAEVRWQCLTKKLRAAEEFAAAATKRVSTDHRARTLVHRPITVHSGTTTSSLMIHHPRLLIYISSTFQQCFNAYYCSRPRERICSVQPPAPLPA